VGAGVAQEIDRNRRNRILHKVTKLTKVGDEGGFGFIHEVDGRFNGGRRGNGVQRVDLGDLKAFQD
jgi:hypothetical protein